MRDFWDNVFKSGAKEDRAKQKGRTVSDGGTASFEPSFCLTHEAILWTMEFYVLGCLFKYKARSVVDLGCATGSLMRAMYRNPGMRVPYLGVDINDYHEYIKPPGRFWQCDLASNWPFKTESLEMVVLSEVLEHLSEIDGRKLVSRIFRSLKEDGHLILTSPKRVSGLDFQEELRKYGHIHYWKIRELDKIANRYGVKRIEKWTSRFIGTRIPWKEITAKVSELHSEPLMELLRARYGSLIAGAMLYHVLPSNRGTHIQVVYKRKRK